MSLLVILLNKRSFYGTFLRCLNDNEISKAIQQVHEKISGGYFNGKEIFHKLLRLGYYWPFIEKDCILYVRKYEKYQKNAKVILYPSSELATMVSP